MKRKEKQYLPLFWCRNLKKNMTDTFGCMINPEEILELTNTIQRETAEQSSEMVEKFCMKYPKFHKVLESICFLDKIGRISATEMWNETLKDLLSMANVTEWSRNKQVFKFDADFLDELVRTENLTVNKNAWDYLPFRSFYVDISDNKRLCESLKGEGIFITVNKCCSDTVYWQDKEGNHETDTAYEILLCKIDDKFFYTDTLLVPNGDYDCTLNGEEETIIERHDIKYNKNGRMESIKSNTIVNTKAYQTIIVQILNYLASVEPDIAENKETKRTYKPRTSSASAKPEQQDKFSEIRKWDVGVRFGNSYRRWKAEGQSGTERGANGKHTGKRPHSRKAHWHHFWYGSGENKVCRPKWLNQTFINADKQEQAGSPVTIHQCS